MWKCGKVWQSQDISSLFPTVTNPVTISWLCHTSTPIGSLELCKEWQRFRFVTTGKVWHYPDVVGLFHTSTPFTTVELEIWERKVGFFHTSTPRRSVELRMEKESRDLVASAGHLWAPDEALGDRRLSTWKQINAQWLMLYSVSLTLVLDFYCTVNDNI